VFAYSSSGSGRVTVLNADVAGMFDAAWTWDGSAWQRRSI
jgi:hypothetical protein